MYDEVGSGTIAGGAALAATGAYAWLGPFVAVGLALLFVGVLLLRLSKD